jgi:hypothetical protein
LVLHSAKTYHNKKLVFIANEVVSEEFKDCLCIRQKALSLPSAKDYLQKYFQS